MKTTEKSAPIYEKKYIHTDSPHFVYTEHTNGKKLQKHSNDDTHAHTHSLAHISQETEHKKECKNIQKNKQQEEENKHLCTRSPLYKKKHNTLLHTTE